MQDIKKMKMPVYRFEIIVLDFEKYGPDDFITEIEQNRYISGSVTKVEVKDAGEWDDNHPLNQRNTDKSAFFDKL